MLVLLPGVWHSPAPTPSTSTESRSRAPVANASPLGVPACPLAFPEGRALFPRPLLQQGSFQILHEGLPLPSNSESCSPKARQPEGEAFSRSRLAFLSWPPFPTHDFSLTRAVSLPRGGMPFPWNPVQACPRSALSRRSFHGNRVALCSNCPVL